MWSTLMSLPRNLQRFQARIMDGRGIQGYSGFSILLRISPIIAIENACFISFFE